MAEKIYKTYDPYRYYRSDAALSAVGCVQKFTVFVPSSVAPKDGYPLLVAPAGAGFQTHTPADFITEGTIEYKCLQEGAVILSIGQHGWDQPGHYTTPGDECGIPTNLGYETLVAGTDSCTWDTDDRTKVLDTSDTVGFWKSPEFPDRASWESPDNVSMEWETWSGLQKFLSGFASANNLMINKHKIVTTGRSGAAHNAAFMAYHKPSKLSYEAGSDPTSTFEDYTIIGTMLEQMVSTWLPGFKQDTEGMKCYVMRYFPTSGSYGYDSATALGDSNFQSYVGASAIASGVSPVELVSTAALEQASPWFWGVRDAEGRSHTATVPTLIMPGHTAVQPGSENYNTKGTGLEPSNDNYGKPDIIWSGTGSTAGVGITSENALSGSKHDVWHSEMWYRYLQAIGNDGTLSNNKQGLSKLALPVAASSIKSNADHFFSGTDEEIQEQQLAYKTQWLIDIGFLTDPYVNPLPDPYVKVVETVMIGDIPTTSGIDASIRAGTRIKNFIMNASQQHHKIPLVYKETLRALLSIFGGLKYVNPSNDIVPIKCVHGNPERIVAKLMEQTNIILPILSVIQTSTDDDIARRRYEPTLIHQKYFDEDKQRAVRVLSLVPKALNINYNINIWSKYRSDLDQILEQIRLLFNPELIIPTPFSSNTKAYISTEFDNSTLTAGDKEDRILKRGVTISVQTYLPNPKFLITSSGKIERFNTELEVY